LKIPEILIAKKDDEVYLYKFEVKEEGIDVYTSTVNHNELNSEFSLQENQFYLCFDKYSIDIDHVDSYQESDVVSENTIKKALWECSIDELCEIYLDALEIWMESDDSQEYLLKYNKEILDKNPEFF